PPPRSPCRACPQADRRPWSVPQPLEKRARAPPAHGHLRAAHRVERAVASVPRSRLPDVTLVEVLGKPLSGQSHKLRGSRRDGPFAAARQGRVPLAEGWIEADEREFRPLACAVISNRARDDRHAETARDQVAQETHLGGLERDPRRESRRRAGLLYQTTQHR